MVQSHSFHLCAACSAIVVQHVAVPSFRKSSRFREKLEIFATVLYQTVILQTKIIITKLQSIVQKLLLNDTAH